MSARLLYIAYPGAVFAGVFEQGVSRAFLCGPSGGFYRLHGGPFFTSNPFDGYSADRLDYDGGTLDLALEWRLSSPAASDDIVIVDIDERSLALLAEDYGRWPWPRSVMGDFLALLSEREPAAIGVNVMYSDADLNDPDGDALLGEIIGYLPNVTVSYDAAVARKRQPERGCRRANPRRGGGRRAGPASAPCPCCTHSSPRPMPTWGSTI